VRGDGETERRGVEHARLDNCGSEGHDELTPRVEGGDI